MFSLFFPIGVCQSVGFSVCYPYLNSSVVGLVGGRPLPVPYNAIGRPIKTNFFSKNNTIMI